MRSLTLQIDSSESLSDEAIAISINESRNKAPHSLVAILMPATWTAADLTFQASNDNTTFYNMVNTAGNEVTVTGPAASEWVAIDPADFVGVEYLKVRSGSSGAAVAQGGDRVLTFLTRPVS
jgi:hypothetical protein